jgi:tetratricopeptide (TPR) repeat protein
MSGSISGRAAAGRVFAVVTSAFCLALAGQLPHATAQGPAIAAPGGAGQGFRRTVPTDYYFAVCSQFNNGNYLEALSGFQSCVRSAVKTTTAYWIDSICYQAMLAETNYQLGRMPEALDHSTRAIQLAIATPDWLIPVHFTPNISPRAAGNNSQCPWGKSQREVLVGQFPDTVLMRQGNVDNSAVIQRGGIVQQAVEFPINPQEIVRCTCLALRRRRELLGPMAPHDQISKQLLAVLSKRPVQPNHWTEAWIDVQLGCAFAATGNDAQAKPLLEKSIITGGQYDHPLTPIALLELGRIALTAGDHDLASRYFQEASYSAYTFYDPLICEEALRNAALVHILANRPGRYLSLSPAADWARKDIRHVQASAIAMAAEIECLLDAPKAAQTMLDNGRTVTQRSDMGKSRIGARLSFAQALTSYQMGDVVGGDKAANAALAFMQTGSLKLSQMRLADLSVVDRNLTPRAARDIFRILLRDPTPADWAHDPLESMATLVFPHLQYFERWFELAIESKEKDGRVALEITDLAKRHKFLSQQEFGGRMLNLRWLLESPTDSLAQEPSQQRQTLLTQFPAYENLSKQARAIRQDLNRLPLVSVDTKVSKEQATKLLELERVTRDQEMMLKVMAVRRSATNLVFPPAQEIEEVQKQLPSGHAVLSFSIGSRGSVAFLMTNDKFGYWPIPAPDEVIKKLSALLQAMGNYDDNKVQTSADLANGSWREPSRELLDILTRESKANIPYGFSELIIVPDHYTWYVPFEALCATAQEGPPKPLVEQVRIRYAPTVGLAVGDKRPRLETGRSLVTVGRLHVGDADESAEGAFAELTRSLPQAEMLKLRGLKMSPAGSLLASLVDRLIVYADITPSTNGPLQWAPLTGEKSGQGGSLNEWLRLPLDGPEQIALPGFHTAAEAGLKKLQMADAGNELFQATTGLMASGARTILITRWRPAGRTSFDLVREFMQELPYVSASQAWRRSVMLARQAQITPESEPRVRLDGTSTPPKADHPFFWGGFLVVDTGTEPATPATAEKTDKADDPQGKSAPKGGGE